VSSTLKAESLYSDEYSFTVSGALIPECNGLSQFIEDTGKPSEFNLVAYLLA